MPVVIWRTSQGVSSRERRTDRGKYDLGATCARRLTARAFEHKGEHARVTKRKSMVNLKSGKRSRRVWSNDK